MKIIIGFSSPKNKSMIFANIIEAVEKRPFSHVFIKYNDPVTNIPMVFQASHGLVHICLYERFCSDNNSIIQYELEFSQKEFNDFYILLLSLCGTRYGFLELLGIAFKKITHLESPIQDGLQSVICSELAAHVCELKSIPLPKNLDSITPSDLNEILKGIYG